MIVTRLLLPLFAFALGATGAAAAKVDKSDNGVIVSPDRGPAKRVRVQVYGDGLFRVTAVPDAAMDLPDSFAVIAKPGGDFQVVRSRTSVAVRTGRGSAEVRLTDGFVTVRDSSGRILLAQSRPAQFWPVSAGGKPFLGISQQFNRGTNEGFYGLGQHQEGVMNYLGKDVELAQHNMDIAVPFVLSTRNYGLLWDNYSISRFGNPKPYQLAGRDTLKVTGSDGHPGFSAVYSIGDRKVLERNEPAINYQYIGDQKLFPAEALPPPGSPAKAHVTWRGRLSSPVSGVHDFQLYASSYFKLYVDGKLVFDRWRQNWNPWFHDFQVPMQAGKPVDVRIEWEPDGGYIALLHNDPLPAADRNSLWFTSEDARGIDYYVVAGSSMDDVIAGYRKLTGKASMMPKWAYGFWQSRQRYETQDQLLGVVRDYRRLGIPLDNIVQDWFYWPEDQWGSHRFDPARYPDPKGMIEEVHREHAQFMISVWPKFYPATDNYRELAAQGHVYTGSLQMGLKDWVGPGYVSTVYDPYSSEARDTYWRQMRDRLAILGVDAWWMDAPEPDIQSNLSIEERKFIMGPTAKGPADLFFNSYPLIHACGVDKGSREFRPDVRPFILTRSAFAGLQRCGAAVWSGDVASRWDDLRNQISAGVNLSMSGIPNWTHDIGGFALEDRYTRRDPAHVEEWRELNLRWFQFGAFSPLFRSHGEFPRREIYEISPEGSPMRESMLWYDNLRHRLMPYIYTLAADTWQRDGIIMRGLVMDFPADPKVRTLNDEYLFGHAFLVAPVTRFKARSRSVYLPVGAGWYDFDGGGMFAGGRAIAANAPYGRVPLFVRAGSIVPVGPAEQYVGEKPDAPLTLLVYTGADGDFSLYEDDGVSEAFARGAFSRIPLAWNQATGTLTIGKREGSYAGMPAEREIRIRFVTPRSGGFDPDAAADRTVRYAGASLAVGASAPKAR